MASHLSSPFLLTISAQILHYDLKSCLQRIHGFLNLDSWFSHSAAFARTPPIRRKASACSATITVAPANVHGNVKLNDLPSHIILHIMSFMSMCQAGHACCAVLSNLRRSVPCMNIDFDYLARKVCLLILHIPPCLSVCRTLIHTSSYSPP